MAQCDKIITDKDWTGRRKRRCSRDAVFVDIHGRNLCGHHRKQWEKKISKHPKS